MPVANRSTSPDITTVFYGEGNNIEEIKAPIFLEAVLAIKIIKELQSNLEEKINPNL